MHMYNVYIGIVLMLCSGVTAPGGNCNICPRRHHSYCLQKTHCRHNHSIKNGTEVFFQHVSDNIFGRKRSEACESKSECHNFHEIYNIQLIKHLDKTYRFFQDHEWCYLVLDAEMQCGHHHQCCLTAHEIYNLHHPTSKPTTLKPTSTHTKTSTRIVPTTTVTTTAPVTTTVSATAAPLTDRPCNRLEVITGLAHTDVVQIYPGLTCSDGVHAFSEATVVHYCHATPSVQWMKGRNVLTECSQIEPYTAIGTFTRSGFLRDSVAGVFLSCNATSIKLATQDCHHKFQITHVSIFDRDSYTQNALNYFTIHWK